jgi:hypothetical protein
VVELKLTLAKAPSWVNLNFVDWLAGTAGELAFGITCAIINSGKNSNAATANSRFM